MNDFEVNMAFAEIICEGMNQDDIEALETLDRFLAAGIDYEGDTE